MSVNSRLKKIEGGMTYREWALLWLKTSQEKSSYSESWKFAEFQPWAAENEEAGMIYYLTNMVNIAVLLTTEQLRAQTTWGSLLSLSMFNVQPGLRPLEPRPIEEFVERWRDALCRLFTEVVALQQAVDLISDQYFDGYDVLFSDAKEKLRDSFETAKLLILGYNCFAEENNQAQIDIEIAASQLGSKVEQRLNEWVMVSRSKVLAAAGDLFEARDQVLAFLTLDESGSKM